MVRYFFSFSNSRRYFKVDLIPWPRLYEHVQLDCASEWPVFFHGTEMHHICIVNHHHSQQMTRAEHRNPADSRLVNREETLDIRHCAGWSCTLLSLSLRGVHDPDDHFKSPHHKRFVMSKTYLCISIFTNIRTQWSTTHFRTAKRIITLSCTCPIHFLLFLLRVPSRSPIIMVTLHLYRKIYCWSPTQHHRIPFFFLFSFVAPVWYVVSVKLNCTNVTWNSNSQSQSVRLCVFTWNILEVHKKMQIDWRPRGSPRKLNRKF